MVCAPLTDTNNPPDGIEDYFVNGFDLRKFVLIYDRPNKNLYVLWRMEGIVGDIDGNLTPDNSDCLPAPPRSPTSPASAARRTTRPASTPTATGSPTSSSRSAASWASTRSPSRAPAIGGSQLAYRAGAGAAARTSNSRSRTSPCRRCSACSANSNASFDGLGEDITARTTCGVPNPTIDLTKSVNVPVICPGGSADFTMVVTNTGNVDLTNVSLIDNLPAGLVYQSTVSNTCGGAVSRQWQPAHLRSVQPGGRRLVHDRAPRRPHGRVRGPAGQQRQRRGHVHLAVLQPGPADDRQRQGLGIDPVRQRRLLDRRARHPGLPGRDGRDLRSGRRVLATPGAPARRPAASRSAPARTRWWSPRSPAAASAPTRAR